MSFNKFKSVAIYSILLMLIGYSLFKTYNEPYFWYDEAVQFFDSRGVDYDHYKYCNILEDVWHKNARFNMDPGGYTFLMNYWSRISIDPFFLRSFNLAILVIVLFVLSKFFNKVTNSYFRTGVILLFLIIVNDGMLVDRAIEFRAYMLEILCTVVGIYLLMNPKKLVTSNTVYILVLLFLSFSMWTRYSASIYVYILWFYIGVFHFGLTKYKTILGFVVLGLNSFLIYIFVLKFQNPFGLPMDYLKYLNTVDGWSFLFEKSTYFVILFILLLIDFILEIKSIGFFNIIKLLNEKKISNVQIGFFFIVSLNLAYLFLALLGRHPYMPSDPRGFIFFFPTVIFSILFFMKKLAFTESQFNFLAVFVITFVFLNRGYLHRGTANHYFKNQISMITDLDKLNKKINITYWPGLSVSFFEQSSGKYFRNVNYQNQPILIHKRTAELYNETHLIKCKAIVIKAGEFHLVHKYGDSLYLKSMSNQNKTLIAGFPFFNQKIFQIKE